MSTQTEQSKKGADEHILVCLSSSPSNARIIGLAKKYTRITELTPEILHTFVSKIVIHERRERFKQNTEQQIDIYFRYIGNTAGL